ncbi:hypothetical protein [Streptomyces sp. N50]|uniref:hypothetical protein n=1 Tax=Streptomyces sp. N50 TaxID=3081765 RepID=UPI002961F848|nr:hypothetical protein [Streptomyces sp. N50]WOX10317.1 hypothetical protein R2B38_16345 [Streptomyces sp. N50]
MSGIYESELDYLVQYGETSSVYFTILWDAAETVAGDGSSVSDVQKAAIRLVGGMLDRGIRVGDVSPREGEEVIPWDLSREEILRRIEREMRMYDDPADYINICWFSTH